MRRLACLVSLACLGGAMPAVSATRAPAAIEAAVAPMPMDRELEMDGVGLACTGVGETRADPKWAAYPIRVEFSNAKDEYMIDALVALANAKGEMVLTVRCDGPWLLLKPPPGTYAVYAQLADSAAMPRSARFTVPAKGQKRVVLQFPGA